MRPTTIKNLARALKAARGLISEIDRQEDTPTTYVIVEAAMRAFSPQAENEAFAARNLRDLASWLNEAADEMEADASDDEAVILATADHIKKNILQASLGPVKEEDEDDVPRCQGCGAEWNEDWGTRCPNCS